MAAMTDPLDPQSALLKRLAGTAGIAPGEMSPNAGPAPALDPPAAAPPLVPDAPAAAPPAAAAPDYSRLSAGFSRDKLNDPNKHSAKYDMARTFAGFDPKQGVTSDVLAALNKLGYGTFSGSGDKVNLSGLTDVGRKAGLTGDYSGADDIQGLHSDNPQWGYADPYAEAQQGGGSAPVGAPMGGGGLPGGNIDSLLSGDPMAQIQAALAQYAGQPRSNASALLQKLAGG